MGNLFGGGKSRDIDTMIDRLRSAKICNETVAGAKYKAVELLGLSENVRKAAYEQYVDAVNEKFGDTVLEDAKGAQQMFLNNINEYQLLKKPSLKGKAITEAAVMPELVTLTASIATTMRIPYEASLHRLFDTRTLDKQTVEIETVWSTIKAPGEEEEEDLVDALSPKAPTMFIDRTEIYVDTLRNGVELTDGAGVKNLKLLEGKNPLFRINRDVRVSHIDAVLNGASVPRSRIFFHKGVSAFFDGKSNELNMLFDIYDENGHAYVADLSAKIDFQTSTLTYLRGDPAITKVYFYATVSHEEHTHPIKTSFSNSFKNFVVPTRPHIEVSITNERRTDIENSTNYFSDKDPVALMTENITEIVSRMEDQRLKKALDSGHVYEAKFSYNPPAYFSEGNTEWLKREFIPRLDQAALKMKSDHNLTDCHFRVGVSPYVLKLLDTDYTMDKSLTEESRGSGPINYSIGVKTSTNQFYFVSSQWFEDDELRMLLIPNNFALSAVKTYNYFKYSSFLTDQIRRSDNSVMPAVTYTERNLPIVFEALCTNIKIDGMPTMATEGTWVMKAA